GRSIVLTYNIKNFDLFPWSPIYKAIKLQYITFRLIYKLSLNHRIIPSIYNRAIKEHNPSILHSHFGHQGWYDIPLAQKHNLKQIVTFYGLDVTLIPQSQKWQKRYLDLFEHANLILCEGPHMAQEIIALGCPSSKVKIQRLGVDVNGIPYKSRKLTPNESFKILIASSFREKKGIPYALRAIGELKSIFPNLLVTIIGDATSGKKTIVEKERILNTINQYELQSIITLRGFQPHNVLMEEAYKHHVFLSPSVTASDGDTEGGAPVSIIEMAASGIPIISTNHCDIPNVIKHNVTGLLSNERDIEGLVKNLKWLIENLDKWEGITRKARLHIEKYFDVYKQSQKLGDIYSQVISSKSN
ncbi:MAG: glycosyltransferase, partial [Anaerolineales bacterium]